MDIRFADHEAFHRATAGMVGTALIAGTALHPVTAMAPLLGGVAGIAIGAALGYGKPVLRLAFGAAAIALLAATPALFAVSAGMLGLGLALGGGPRGVRGAIAAIAAAGVVLVAMWCALRISTANETASWAGIVRDAVGAGAMGMVGIVAMLPRHLRMTLDPVAAAVRRMPTDMDPEVRALCNRAVGIWTATEDRLAEQDAHKALLRDGVLKTLEVAAKSTRVKVTGAGEAELATRMADLDARIAAATDAEAKAQYQQARAALDDQKRYRAQIGKGQERMVARMHHHVASLEKFQLAATGVEAARMATEGATAVKQLAELSQDVAASGEALAEIELGDAPATVVTAS